MPAVPWTIFRFGARLAAIDGLFSRTDPARVQLDRLQALTSAVAVADLAGVPATDDAPGDDRFVARVALGILCRGWPTLSSPAVEEAVLGSVTAVTDTLQAEPIGRAGEIGWRLSTDSEDLGDWPTVLAAALATCDRRLSAAPSEFDGSWQPPDPALAHEWDSASERRFYDGELASLFGGAIGLVELQRPLETMVPPESQPEHGPWVRLPWRRADFTIELPGPDAPWRLNIELDGPHHRLDPHQRHLDRERDTVLKKAGWTVVRVPTEALNEPDHPASAALMGEARKRIDADPVFHALVHGPRPATDEPVAREALRLLLTPHAVARVQLGVVLALLRGSLRLDAEVWEVVAIEREAPCAEVALLDLLQTLRHLCQIYGIRFGVERVRLRVDANHLAAFPPLPIDGFSESVRGLMTAEPVASAGTPADLPVPDLVLDVGVLARPTQRYGDDWARGPGIVGRTHLRLRTAQRTAGAETPRWDRPRPAALDRTRLRGSESGPADEGFRPGAVPIPAIGQSLEAPREPLRYFLRTLFRKESFRPGQLEIVDRALARKDVIGLLPTGAGKSICYQLPALLSPGQTLVVDPIKSLMQDQIDNLAAAGIHDAIAINSDQPPAERRAAEAAFGRGEFRFVFVSPERLQIRGFRDRVESVGEARPTAFVVVDEAHCVSEWGHDFRIAYLNLGRLSRELCNFAGTPPPIVALTGTASRAVLVDVQRELRIDDPEAIVSPASFDRPELHFAVSSVNKEKLPELIRWIKEHVPRRLAIPTEDLLAGGHGGIVFCPHVNGPFGVYPVHEKLGNALRLHASDDRPDRIGYYSGSMPNALERQGKTEMHYTNVKLGTQRRFKQDELAILVATKAFGMGIDKPNIRYTVHYNMPESVEAFAQEAGRAGRDRSPALCVVLVSDTKHDHPDDQDPLQIGIAVEEARQRLAGQQQRDDADRVLWLHNRSYAGVEAESRAVRGFYRHFVVPRFAAATNGDAVQLPITDHQATESLTQQGYLPPKQPASKNGEPTEELIAVDVQRIVYRLSLLGIVADYTIEYSGGMGDTYAITLSWPAPESVRGRLREYVERYRFSNAAEAVEAAYDLAPFADPIERAIHALCWFTYEEVEKQRRADIHTMRQYLRDSLRVPDPGMELRRLLNAHLSESQFTVDVESLLGSGGIPAEGPLGLPARLATADGLLGRVDGPNDADQLVGQARRSRSADPDNPALLALIGLGLAHNPRRDPDDAADNLSVSLALLERRHPEDSVDRAAGWMIETLAKPFVPLGEQVTWWLLAKERGAGGDRIARAAFRRVSSPRLKRACAIPFLRTMDDEVGRALGHCFGRGDRTDG